jgi:hypothetical protein
MATPRFLPLYDEFLDDLVEKASPEAILAFNASPEAQAYAQELLERLSAGTISVDEEQVLQQMLQFEHLMSLLKAKALHALQT